VTDINSPEVQAIFAQLHALGVTPEQAAAGMRAAIEADDGLYRVGDRVRIVRLTRADGTPTTRDDWTPVVAKRLGQVGVVGKTDYTSGGRDNTEVRVHVEDDYLWLAHDALDLVPERASSVWSQVYAAEWTARRDDGAVPLDAAKAATQEADLAVDTARVVRLLQGAKESK